MGEIDLKLVSGFILADRVLRTELSAVEGPRRVLVVDQRTGLTLYEGVEIPDGSPSSWQWIQQHFIDNLVVCEPDERST